jgi:hypothetical protein
MLPPLSLLLRAMAGVVTAAVVVVAVVVVAVVMTTRMPPRRAAAQLTPRCAPQPRRHPCCSTCTCSCAQRSRARRHSRCVACCCVMRLLFCLTDSHPHVFVCKQSPIEAAAAAGGLNLLLRGVSSGGRRASRVLRGALLCGAVRVLAACLAATPPGVRTSAAALAAALVSAPSYDPADDADADDDDAGGNDDDDELDGLDAARQAEEEGNNNGSSSRRSSRRREFTGRGGARRYGAGDGPGLMAVAADAELLAVLTYVAQRDAVPMAAVAAAAALRTLAGARTTRYASDGVAAGGAGYGRVAAWRAGALEAMRTHRGTYGVHGVDAAAAAAAAAAEQDAALADEEVRRATHAADLAAALAAPPPERYVWPQRGGGGGGYGGGGFGGGAPLRGAALAAEAAAHADAATAEAGWHAAEAALPGGPGVLSLRHVAPVPPHLMPQQQSWQLQPQPPQPPQPRWGE